MKRQMTIGKKLFTSFGLLLILTLAVSASSILIVHSLSTRISSMAHLTARKQYLVGDLKTRIAEVVANERGILLHAALSDKAGVEQQKAQAARAIEQIRRDLTEITPLVETAQGRQQIDEIQKKMDPLATVCEQIWQLATTDKYTEATALYSSNFAGAVASVQNTAEAFRKLQINLMNSASASAESSAALSYWIVIGAVLLSLLIGGIVIWMVHEINVALRRFVADLNNNSHQVASASGQIAATSQSLSQGSSEQAASLEQISASMEEMTAMSKRNSENSGEMTAMMAETAAQVTRSNAALQEMVASMGAIKTSSEKVARIIKTIDEIAFQTNILALNAAVEAARAGEAGMGFAVVADEVRNLAQRSAVAAKDTSGLIEEAIGSSNQGAEKLEQVGVAIRAITESAGKVKHLSEEVNESSKQQTQGIQQASTALTQVSAVTQTAAASAEESAAASEQLSAQAQGMRDLVERLRGMVGSDGAHPVKAGRPKSSPAKRLEMTRAAAHLNVTSKAAKFEPAQPTASSDDDPFPMETVEVGNFKSF